MLPPPPPALHNSLLSALPAWCNHCWVDRYQEVGWLEAQWPEQATLRMPTLPCTPEALPCTWLMRGGCHCNRALPSRPCAVVRSAAVTCHRPRGIECCKCSMHRDESIPSHTLDGMQAAPAARFPVRPLQHVQRWGPEQFMPYPAATAEASQCAVGMQQTPVMQRTSVQAHSKAWCTARVWSQATVGWPHSASGWDSLLGLLCQPVVRHHTSCLCIRHRKPLAALPRCRRDDELHDWQRQQPQPCRMLARLLPRKLVLPVRAQEERFDGSAEGWRPEAVLLRPPGLACQEAQQLALREGQTRG